MRERDRQQPRPIILIVGPTAGGKTRLAIELAKALPGEGTRDKGQEPETPTAGQPNSRTDSRSTQRPAPSTGSSLDASMPGCLDASASLAGEIIGCDSMQVYRGMDIGTAKPTAAERAEAVHHLIDIADPKASRHQGIEASSDESFTVDRWLSLAEVTIADVRARGKWPIVVGGTNLYVQALLCGFDSGPPPDDELRAELSELDEVRLRARLEEVDPVSAARIHPNDRKRTIRAIEVFEQTGSSISDSQTHWETMMTRRDVMLIGLDYPAEEINPRINARVRQMIADGLVDEVRRLNAPPLGPLGMQAREALGYRQIINHLEGRMSLEEAVEQIKIRTRRFAKQQRTWLRRFRTHKPSIWLDAAGLSPQELVDQSLAFIAEHAGDAYAE